MYVEGVSDVNVGFLESENYVFDTHIWSCPVYLNWPGGDDKPYELEPVIKYYVGPDGANTEGACYIDNNYLYVDGKLLADAGITRIVLAVRLKADGMEDIWSEEGELDIRKAGVERYFGVENTMTAGDEQFVDTNLDGLLVDYDHPTGEYVTMTVTDITASDTDVVSISSEENGWKLRAEGEGECVVTLTYTDYDDTEGQIEEIPITVNPLPCHITIKDDEAQEISYDTLACPFLLEGFDGYEFTLSVFAVDHNGPEDVDIQQAFSYPSDSTAINVEQSMLRMYGVSWVKVRVEAIVNGITIYDECEFDIKQDVMEKDFDFGDCDMLPGWEQRISNKYNCYLVNKDFQEGKDFDLPVTSVTVSDGSVVSVTSDDEGWILRAKNEGECTVTVTYTDWDDLDATEDFTIKVGSDVYSVDLWPESGSDRALPGKTVTMQAQAHHEQYLNGEQHNFSEEEMAEVTYNWEIEDIACNGYDLTGCIVVIQDDSDPKKAEVSFNDIPVDCDGAAVRIRVSVSEDGEHRASNDYMLFMNDEYYELWPTRIGDNPDVGEEITITPEIRRYPGEEGQEYDVLTPGEVRFAVETYDDNAYEITDNGDGMFTVLRKKEYETSFRIKAFVNDEETDSREYRLDDLGYRISIREDQGTGDLFNDGEWSCPVEVEGLDGTDYTLTAWAEDHNGPEGTDATGAVRVATEEKRLYINGEQLGEMGISWIKVAVSAEVNDYEISDRSERDFDVREPKIERNFDFGDRDLLPGWDQWIDRKQNCHVENGENPYGCDFELIVTDVAVSDENVVRIENSDENGWNLRAENMGECTVTVTYTDWDGSEQTGEFTLYVGSDVYDVDMWTEDGSFKVLPGGTVTMYAQASHEQYDPETGEQHNCSDDEMSGIAYNWEVEVVDADKDTDLNDCITVTQDEEDPRKAVVSFNDIPEECNWANVKVIVAIKENGEETARTDRWISMSREYLELWPTELYGDLDVGDMILFTLEVREYPADNENGYNVLPSGQVRFETEIYDDSAYTLDVSEDGSLSLKRLREYRSSFRIKAFVKNENGDWEYADDREYWLNEKNYEIRYDIEGNDTIYSDGERTFALDLSGLGDANYEIVPYVGTGEFGEDGFENSLAEGEGWSYDKDTGRITFYGDDLYNMDIGRIETKIVVMMGGIEVASEQRDFDVREAVYDYHGAFNDMTMLLSDGTWYMGKKGNVYVESSVFPDGAEGTYEITDLKFTSEEDEFDTRDPISLESDEDNWKITPVRNGMAQMHANVELKVSDGTTDYQADEELDFTVVVGGWRYDIWLKTSTGSDRLQTGGEITLFPETHGEGYDWQTGEHFDIDTSGYEVRYEVMCTHVDQRIVDEQYGGDLEAASARGALWDYTEDTENRSIVLQAKDNAYGLDLEVKAFLIDTETGEDCAGNSRTIFVDAMVFELALCDEDGDAPAQWKEELPPGGEFVFTPAILRSELNGETAPIGNPEDVTYTMDWNAGDGDGDPAHLQIKKANGEYLYPGDEVKAEDAPFTVKRMLPWNENLSIRAQWNDEEGNQQELWKDLSFIEVNYGGGFIKNNNRGDDHFTWYYTEESIDIKPDRAALDALAAQGYEVNTTVEIGIWDGENINPIKDYNPVAKGIFTQENGLQVSGDALAELKSALEAANGDGSARVNMRVVSVLGDVLLADDDVFTVHIVDSYREIRGLERKMGLGTEQSWQGGQAKLYIEDSGHDTGVNSYYGMGATFDITITDISIDNYADEEFLAAVNEDGAWKLKAKGLTDHEIPVTFTFTGGPEGYTTCTDAITITGDVFEAELGDFVGEENSELDILMGDTASLWPTVTHIAYKEEDGTIVESEETMPCESFTYTVEFNVQNDSIISVDTDNGNITPLKTGTTDLEVVVRVLDADLNECDRMYFPVKVVVSTFFVKLEVPEDAVFYVGAGQSYEVSEIAESVGAMLRVYSMKKPEGETLTVSQYLAQNLSGDGTDMKLSGEVDGAFTSLNVADDVTEGSETLTLSAVDDGEEFSAQVKVAVHPYDQHDFSEWDVTKEATCTENGSKERVCSICNYKEIEDIPALGHDMEHTPAKEASCTEDGNIEYWKCNRCEKFFSDEAGTTEITEEETVTEALGHDLEHIPAKAATVKETGNIGYWKCRNCGKLFSDAKGTKEIEQGDTVIPKLTPGWKKDANGWKYLRADGTYPKSKFEVIDGKTYYFNKSEYRVTGLQEIEGNKYYFASDGVMQKGWQTIGANKYYFKTANGAMHKGWLKTGGKMYYFKMANGAMHTGWLKTKGALYYFKKTGEMHTGWLKVNGKLFYFKTSNGVMLTGWLKTNGKMFYFDTNGVMHKGWLQKGSKKFYFKSNGVMVTGRYKIGTKWYTFSSSGVLQ